MSTVLSLKQAPAATIDLLLEKPELAVVFWTNPDYTPPKTHGFWLWIAHLFGDRKVRIELPEAPPELDRSGDDLRLDGDWNPFGSGEAPLPSVGNSLPGSDHGYGDDRAIRHDEVADLRQQIAARPPTAADSQRDHQRLVDFLNATINQSLGLVIKIS